MAARKNISRTSDESVRPSPLILAAFFLSGAAALGYQVLWSKMFALTLGHEFAAVIAVVATIFGGMAVGGALANKLLPRLGDRPLARLEICIGIFGAFSPLIILNSNLAWISVLAAVPAAVAMGATLPAMAQLSAIPAAYAANTLGAVAGCLGAAFVLMPRLGLVWPVVICSMANFAAAFLARRFKPNAPAPNSRLLPRYASIFFITGFVGLGFEVLGVRLLSMSLENTVFTFAVILAIYLLGQSIGAAFIRLNPALTATLLAAAIVIALWQFRFSAAVYEALRTSLGNAPAAVFASELLTALFIFAAPTLFMGALFARLAARAGQGALGRALLWNGVGAAIGAILVPAILPTAIFKPLVQLPPASTLRELRVGRMATVAVTETPDGQRTLFVNNRFQMGGTAATIPELRHAHIPLLLHPAPQRALVLGLGTGITLSACATYPNLQTDGVELLPEIVAVMPHFFPNSGDSPLRATNIAVHAADARRFVRNVETTYDVIIADLFHPAADGAAFLYTREHFQRIQSRLTTNGLFCQWLPLHQLDLATFRDITRTFQTVFPNAEAWLLRPNIDAPVVGLIGYKSQPTALTGALIESRLPNAQLRRVALADPVRLFGSFVAGPEALRAFAHEGRVNTDTFPIVMFQAPAFSYLRNAPTHERLLAFLDQIGSRTPNISDTNLQTKVGRFIQARDVYLRALVAEANNQRLQAIDGYIESARRSEDFTSGYAQCLAIATAESKSNPTLARDILQRLIAAQPNRPVAKELLDRLSASP